ncbi:hypothetical protein [Anatilimnocola floriformis]|uniref:hypothetical protein n=1 Tax=Anatilimnocola floriformis TaxID=2948575 RepID=UPI0020C38634|nr:hypothetical protein [Anatilimnocola floriformis]
MQRICFAVIFALWCGVVAAQEAGKVTWDFEKQTLGAEWTAGGKITATRAIGEPAQKPKASHEGDAIPGGQVATISAQPGAFFGLKKELPRVPWERVQRISFWLSRSEEEAKRDPECEFDLFFLNANNKPVFSRKFVFKGSGWQQFEAPTLWIAPTTGRIGSWSGVQRFTLSFREESHLSLDAVQVDVAAQPQAPVALEDILPIAFPGVAPAAIKTAKRGGLVVATNATDCNPEKVAAILQSLEKKIAADLPLGDSAVPPTLLIFATRDEYQKFPPRLAMRYGKDAAEPQSDGFTMLGWATSSWDSQQGAEQPVFVHEFVHSLLERRLQIANQGEWFQEGMATFYQLQQYPQKNMGEVIQLGISREQYDLAAVTSGKHVSSNAFWQAATLCSLLLRDPSYAPKLKDLVAGFQREQSTALEPQLEPVLKVSFERLTNDWKKHCREAWPVR